MYVCVYVYLYVCNVCMCMYVRMCVYVCMCVCMYVYVHIYICMYVCMYVCVFMYVCVCMYECLFVCLFIYLFIPSFSSKQQQVNAATVSDDFGTKLAFTDRNLKLSSPTGEIGEEKCLRLRNFSMWFFFFFFFFYFVNFCLLSPDHRQRIGWGAISTALHNMKYINILYNSLKYCIGNASMLVTNTFYCPGQRNPRRPTPVPVTGVSLQQLALNVHVKHSDLT